jgi:hypothetical protein
LAGKKPLAAGKPEAAPEKSPLARLPAKAAAIPSGATESRVKAPTVKQLIHSLKLPQDSLSVTLLNLARNFSLPLEPALFSRLRREALTLKARRTGRGASVGPRELAAAARATAAAASKGVILTEKALEQYAQAIDPDYAAEEQDSPEHGEGQSFGGEERDAAHEGEELRKILGEAAGRQDAKAEPDEESLLGILNRLPGKEGDFWTVYPYKMKFEALEIRVSVWILLPCKDYNKDYRDSAKKEAVRGIAVHAVGKERRWVFSMMNPGRPDAKTRVSVSPPYREPVREKIEKEIREVLGDFGGMLNVAAQMAEPWDMDDGSDGPFLSLRGFSGPVEEDA